MPILYRCRFDTTGLAYAAYGYAIGLEEAGIPVSVDIDGDGDGTGVDSRTYAKISTMAGKFSGSGYVHISHAIPENIRISSGSVANVASTVCEAMNLSRHWLNIFAPFDAAIVPSHFCLEQFETLGLPRERLAFVPHVVDGSLYRRQKCGGGNKYTFLFMNAWLNRKGWRETVTCYAKAFRGERNVRLLIKTVAPERVVRQCVEAAMKSVGVSGRETPDVEFFCNPMPGDLLPSFMVQADCFVSPHSGEGFGLNIANAMSLGIPCIVTNWGGSGEFCRSNTCRLVKVSGSQKTDPATASMFPFYRNAMWAKVDEDDLTQALLEALSADWSTKVIAASAAVGRYTYALVGKAFAEAITQMVPKINQDKLCRGEWCLPPERFESVEKNLRLVEL
jgi:glycosyltransferase involved in cell wall biosynthesis